MMASNRCPVTTMASRAKSGHAIVMVVNAVRVVTGRCVKAKNSAMRSLARQKRARNVCRESSNRRLRVLHLQCNRTIVKVCR